jgi:hypothetical protein
VNQLYYEGKLVSEKDTCSELKVSQGAVFFAIKTGASTGSKGIRWFRTSISRITPDSSWYMSSTSRDALRFIAKRRVLILGYGCTGPKASEHPS